MKDRLGGNDSSSKQALQCVKTCQNVFYHFDAISAKVLKLFIIYSQKGRRQVIGEL